MEDSKTTSFLLDEFFFLKDTQIDGQKGSFQIIINPQSRVFKGHFPGNPICPGVCQIEMIRECASMLQNKDLRIDQVKKCRFLSVARPDSQNILTITLELTPIEDTRFSVTASIADDNTQYLTLSSIMKEG